MRDNESKTVCFSGALAKKKKMIELLIKNHYKTKSGSTLLIFSNIFSWHATLNKTLSLSAYLSYFLWLNWHLLDSSPIFIRFFHFSYEHLRNTPERIIFLIKVFCIHCVRILLLLYFYEKNYMIELYRNFIKNSTWEPNDPKSYTSREESWEHWHKEILYYERTPTCLALLGEARQPLLLQTWLQLKWTEWHVMITVNLGFQFGTHL